MSEVLHHIDQCVEKIDGMSRTQGIEVPRLCKYVRFERPVPVSPAHFATPKPTPAQGKDIEFGWHIAEGLRGLGVGQSLVVKEQDVIAVEASEGTDQVIERAGDLCKSGGWCLFKISSSSQDKRFSIPTISPDIVEQMHHHGGKVLCAEAGRTVIEHPGEVALLAEQYGIVVSIHPGHWQRMSPSADAVSAIGAEAMTSPSSLLGVLRTWLGCY